MDTATRHGALALTLQEVLTAVVRIRANRQTVSDAQTFRANIRAALKTAVREARGYGYTNEEIQLGMLAVVGFLDESILNSDIPALADWPRETMSHELFGHHLAGEIFFDNLDRLLGMQDSTGVADVLEVYRLCLLLGFRGKYGAARTTESRALADTAGAKIRRIRGHVDTLFPPESPAPALIPIRRSDPVRRVLAISAAVTMATALVLFGVYHAALDSGVSELRSVVAGHQGQ